MSARLMIQAARVCPTIFGLPDQPAVGARRPRLIGCAEGNKSARAAAFRYQSRPRSRRSAADLAVWPGYQVRRWEDLAQDDPAESIRSRAARSGVHRDRLRRKSATGKANVGGQRRGTGVRNRGCVAAGDDRPARRLVVRMAHVVALRTVTGGEGSLLSRAAPNSGDRVRGDGRALQGHGTSRGVRWDSSASGVDQGVGELIASEEASRRRGGDMMCPAWPTGPSMYSSRASSGVVSAPARRLL
jgi:hypothetical protein